MFFICISIFTLFVLYISHFYWKVRQYPKGPFPLPIIGNILSLPNVKIEEYLDDLAKIYGPCYTIWIPTPAVVLSDYEHIKDAFSTQGDTFTYRSQLPPETLLQPHINTGVLFSDGDNWKVQRRTSLRILRDFGLGKSLMEEQVTRSIYELLAQLESIDDKENVDLFWPIQLCVGNVINESLFGYHFSYKNTEKFEIFVQTIDNHMRNIQSKCSLFVQAWPWMKHLPYIGEHGYHKIKNNIISYQGFIQEEVEKQVACFNPDNEPENFVHAYLQQIGEGGGNPNLDMINLCASVLDFWFAGMETTSNSLRWHLAYIMKYPEVQEKVRKEVLEVVGNSRLPTMADKPNMPYTQAVIHEVQRHSNMLPFLPSHQAIKDASILGIKIPANTRVLSQIWSVMRNDPVFEDPLSFNPSRYLLDDGKSFNKNLLERTIPFSLGKRNCVGEGLARMELFLIFSSLVQKYEFIPNAPIDLDPVFGAVMTVKPYTCKIVEQF